jgi:hypothetical protein
MVIFQQKAFKTKTKHLTTRSFKWLIAPLHLRLHTKCNLRTLWLEIESTPNNALVFSETMQLK